MLADLSPGVASDKGKPLPMHPIGRQVCFMNMIRPKLTAVETPVPLPLPDRSLIDNASLFLDFDGTLAEIAPHPGAVVVGDRLRTLLSSLSAKLPGRLAIISGRPIRQLQQLLGPTSLAFGGSHGMELLWPDGRTQQPPRPAAALVPVMQELRRLQKLYSGIVIEQKPYGVALHYRSEPKAEAACRDLATALAQSSGLTLQAGKMVFELRMPGPGKGEALTTLFADPAMAGTTPIFIGDDDTDESAFVAAAKFGGAGILVGPPRATAALYRLDSVRATLDWLEAVAETTR